MKTRRYETFAKFLAGMRRGRCLSALLAVGFILGLFATPAALGQADSVRVRALESEGATAAGETRGPCASCQVINVSNVIHPDTTNFGTITISLGVGGTGAITVTFPNQVEGGHPVGFKIGNPVGLADAELLSTIELRTLQDGTPQDSASGGTTLIVRILGGTGGNVGYVSFTPEQSFNQLEIEVGALASLVSSTDVYYAFAKSPPVVINELLADPADGPAGDANGDGTRDSAEDEFVEIVNISEESVDLSGWMISDEEGLKHTFPSGTVLEPASSGSGFGVTVFGGGSPVAFPGLVQTASSGALELNNSGDTVTLEDATPSVVDEHTYGSEGGDDESLARNACFIGPFVPHSSAFTGTFSPGTCGGEVLPVELATFAVKTTDRSAMFTWTTASETGNAYFHIQQQAEGGAFVDVEGARVASKAAEGTSAEALTYAVTVHDLAPGAHTFRLKQVDRDGAVTYSDARTVEIGLAGRFELTAAYPNPFRSQAQFRLYVKESQDVTIALYNVLGQQVRELFSGHIASGGGRQITVNAAQLASGLYFYRVEGETFTTTRRLTLVK